LNKCFEGIDKLTFVDSDDSSPPKRIIIGMESSMCEKISFVSAVDPFMIREPVQIGKKSTEKAADATMQVRNIEDWLTEVESMMRESLR
jgi:hypothetical protein